MKIIIIGKGDYWQLAPFEGETWGVNDLILLRPFKRLFDLHAIGSWKDKQKQIDTRKKALRINTLYTLDNYPLDELKKFFKTDYFSCSAAYMIALAIYEGATSIDLYGVNMVIAKEYAYQKPCVDYWCGQAMGRGIEVAVYGKTSTIMKTPAGLLYGYLTKQELNHGKQ